MQIHTQFPPALLARAAALWLSGRVKFPSDQLGKIIEEQGAFEIFRKVVVKPAGQKSIVPGAIFKVNFRFAKFSNSTNKVLSKIPIPFIVAQPGFISKTWLYDESTSIFKGVYEWNSVDEAEWYWNSFPMNLMKGRSVPESLNYEVIKVES